MATYNGEKFIAEQIDSILDQTYQNWKLIIHDDGSKDETVALIKQYQKQFPDKIVLIEDGIVFRDAYKNFFHLLKIIDNDFDYLMFSDQDDIWFQSKMQDSLEVVLLEEKYNDFNIPVAVFSDAVVVNETLDRLSPSRIDYVKMNPQIATSARWLAVQSMTTGCTLLLNKSAFLELFPLPSFSIAHDAWVGVVVFRKGKILFLDETTMLHRRHKNNASSANKASFGRLLLKVNLSRIKEHYHRAKSISSYFNENLSWGSFIIDALQVLWLRLTWKTFSEIGFKNIDDE